jgi:cystathionine beta-lyase/cystathionine gamma-synthase
MRFATKALRVGQDLDPQYRCVVQPLYQTATFGWEDLDNIPKFDYTRCGNPNRNTLEQVIAALENGEHCVLFSSGMAAIVAAFSLLKQGDHLLMARDIYGGTFRIAEKYLPRQGITTSEFCANNPFSINEAVQENTKMLIFETPTNPNLRVSDIEAVTKIAKQHGLIVVFDNTFASPALQQPLDLGVDIVVHSTTKYISGHSDVIGGAVVTNDPALHEHIFEWNKAVGSQPSPFDCWLSLRGVKTLACRMRAHCENAQAVAEFLAGHPKVKRVSYPGLPEHPDHQIAKRQMTGFGGMLAFEVDGTVEQARKVAESTKVFLLAESLGGVESLIAYPPLMSHATMTEEQRVDRGIPPTMLRLSVGVEDGQDLIEDLDRALAAI